MRISKGLIIGLVAALAVGAIEAAGENVLQNAVTSGDDGPFSVTVPVGHVGDRLSYTRFTRASAVDEWMRSADSDYQVTSLGQQVDRTGMLHDAVFVTTNGTSGGSGGLLGSESSETTDTFISTAVDLGTGDYLGFRRDDASNLQRFFAMQATDASSENHYGPQSADPHVFGEGLHEKFLLTSFQGATYRLGEERPDVAEYLLVPQATQIHSNWGAVEMRGLSASSTVAQRGRIGDREAVALQTVGCVGFEVSDPRFVYFYPWMSNQIEFLGLAVPVPSQACFTVKTWVASEVPYPLLEEVDLVVDGAPPMQSLTGLDAFAAGDTVIPWGQDSAREHYRAANPAAERSPPGQTFPADGERTNFPYPLSSALRSVAEDPTLVRYSLWRAGHPDAVLAGASMRPLDGFPEGRTWSLVYATHVGDAFVVTTQRTSPSARSQQQEEGEFALGAFPDDQPRPGPITFAAVEELWRTALPAPENTLRPNTAYWGFLFRPAAVYCFAVQDCTAIPAGFFANTPFDEIALGYRAPSGAESDTPVAHVGTGGRSGLMLWVGAYDGGLDLHYGFARQVAWDPLATSADYQPPEPKAVAAVPNAAPVSVEHAAWTSMSFLAFVLVAYFFPTLKFIGTKALFFLPGYTRTKTSELMDNAVRQTMATAIRADPGVTAPQLQALTAVGWSTVVYHLGVLERHGLVSSFLDGRHRRFFPVEAVDASARSRLSLLKNARTRGLYETIVEEPGVGFKELARHVGISRPAVYWHVDRLAKAGLVGQDREGRRIRFYANGPASGAPGAMAREPSPPEIA